MNRIHILLSGFFLLALLGGCDTLTEMKENIQDKVQTLSWSKVSGGPSAEKLVESGGCPKAEIVVDLGSLSEFTDISAPAEQNLVSRVNLTGVETGCSFNQLNMTVDIKLAFQGMLGPQARQKNQDTPFFSYPFFVAVVSPSGDIMAKEIFSASMNYAPGQATSTYYEKLRQIVPVKNRAEGSKYKIMAGFQLTAEQLDYNRLRGPQRVEAPPQTAAVPVTPVERQPVNIAPPQN